MVFMKDFPNLTAPATGDFVVAIEDLGSGNFGDRKIPWATMVSLLGGGSGGIEYETDDTFLATTPDVGTVVLYYPPTDNEASLYVYTSNIGWAFVAGFKRDNSGQIINLIPRGTGDIVFNDENTWIHTGSDWYRLSFPRLVDTSSNGITGTTSETNLLSLQIPPYTLETGDEIAIEWLTSFSSNANNKTQIIRVGGTTPTNGTQILNAVSSGTVNTRNSVVLGYVSGPGSISFWHGGGALTGARNGLPTNYSFSVNNPINVYFNCVLANSADSMSNLRATVWSKR